MKNPVVLITGGARGIGAAIVKEFARNHMDVVINYNTSKKEAEDLQEQLQKEHSVKVMIVKADVSKEDEVKVMIDQIMEQFQHIDILVNNAGIAIDCLFSDKTVENFKKTLDVNVIGTFLMSKYVGNLMYDQKDGAIINISSTNGIDQYYPMCIDYDASKAGVISLTHNLALQFAPYVRVNAVAPGWIATENEMKEIDQEYIQSEEEKIYLHRFGRPEEVAKLVYFLASSDASYINNAIIRIDGGS